VVLIARGIAGGLVVCVCGRGGDGYSSCSDARVRNLVLTGDDCAVCQACGDVAGEIRVQSWQYRSGRWEGTNGGEEVDG